MHRPQAVPSHSAAVAQPGPAGALPANKDAAPVKRCDSDLDMAHSFLVGRVCSHLDLPTLLATSPY